MNVQLKNIEDQVVVVTGASSGIGRATAIAAAERGARVVLAARDEVSLDEVVAEIGDRRACAVVADVADMESLRGAAMLAEQRFGGFDAWINNAGTSVYGCLTDVPLEDARRLFDTNYWGVVHGSLLAAERLRERGGAIVNVGSIVSDRAVPLQGHYSATKHAVKAFTDALRMELEKDEAPIAVTLVKPSAIATPYTEHASNRLREGAPALPPPLYAPEVVAGAIIECLQRPVRELTVGGGGRFLGAAGRMFPRSMDRYMESLLFAQQSDGSNGGGSHPNLHEVAIGTGRVRGDHDRHVMESSLYTSAVLHPWKVLIGLGVAAGLGMALVARRD